ncbi:hypothetical protein ES707_09610 [subsurface metagenome]
MREVLDRLREAAALVDQQLHDTFFSKGPCGQKRAITVLWKAKQNIWWAQMQVLDAFAGHVPEPEI